MVAVAAAFASPAAPAATAVAAFAPAAVVSAAAAFVEFRADQARSLARLPGTSRRSALKRVYICFLLNDRTIESLPSPKRCPFIQRPDPHREAQ